MARKVIWREIASRASKRKEREKKPTYQKIHFRDPLLLLCVPGPSSSEGSKQENSGSLKGGAGFDIVIEGGAPAMDIEDWSTRDFHVHRPKRGKGTPTHAELRWGSRFARTNTARGPPPPREGGWRRGGKAGLLLSNSHHYTTRKGKRRERSNQSLRDEGGRGKANHASTFPFLFLAFPLTVSGAAYSPHFLSQPFLFLSSCHVCYF